MFTNKVIFDKAVAWGVKGSDIHYSQKFNISSLLGNIVSLFFELFDEVLVDCTNGHAEISKTKIESKKKHKKQREGNRKKRKRAPQEFFFVFRVVGPRKILPVAENPISWTGGRNRDFHKPVVNSPLKRRN